MPHEPQPQATHPMVEPGASGLLGLVQRTCQALQAMAASLEALDSVLLRLQRLGPQADPPTELMTGTHDTVSRVIALLRREGPPLLFRAQALRLRLRLHGYAAGSSAAVPMRMLHADLDGLAAFQMGGPEQASHWGTCVRRLRSNTMVLLAEFDGQRRRMTSHEPQPVPPPLNAPASVSIAR
jgi:hypothetical protein